MKELTAKKIVSELGEIEYGVLKDTYCRLRDLREQIRSMHDAFVTNGTPPDLDQVQAAYLLSEELYAGLETFLLPVCAEESSCGPTMCV